MTLALRYGIINSRKGGNTMGKRRKRKKPKKTADDIKTIVEILAGLANIALVIYTILKG